MNALGIEIYSGADRITDPTGDLLRAENLRFRTQYPGGLYADASFYLPRDMLNYLPFNSPRRIVIRNGQTVCYEGWVSNVAGVIDEAAQGIRVTALGAWATYLMNYNVRKRWSDQRYTEDAWSWNTTLSGAEKCTLDRYSRLRFTPKAVAWNVNDFAGVRYTMPPGETIKRIIFTYNLQEGAQQWRLYLRNIDTSTTEWSTDTSGAGSQDITLATPANVIEFRFQAAASQTPPSDGTIFGSISDLTVYSHLGTVDVSGVAQTCVTAIGGLNSTTQYIASNGYWISPFMTSGGDGYESWADVLTRAAAFGDANFDRWAVQMLESERAPTPDGKPVLAVAKFPALTDHEYVISLGDDNLLAPLSISQDFDSIRNYVIVQYQDAEGKAQWVTPDDDANLKDTASISTYGRRESVLNVGHVTRAMAINAGRRQLKARKDAQWRLDAPIQVRGYIRGKAGQPVPASEIKAGKRLRIENYLNDLHGSGLTFILSQTDYDDDSQICSLQTGIPDEIVMPKALRYIQKPPQRNSLDNAGPSGDGDIPNNPGNERRRWWRDIFSDLGLEDPWAGWLRDRSRWREKP
jgi:hypothetical protein